MDDCEHPEIGPDGGCLYCGDFVEDPCPHDAVADDGQCLDCGDYLFVVYD